MSNEKLLINDSKSNNSEVMRNKQIAEIARDFNRGMCSDRESVESCAECVGASEHCLLYKIATRLYTAGYRKQSEGEWVEKDDGFGGVYYDCTACGCSWTTIDGTPMENNMNYCPECGAKMTGSAENATDTNVGNKSEWISVEERLPEENGRYLVFVDISHLAFENLTTIAIMEYGKSHGFYLYNETEKVTHWMPLPEPPKKGGGE